MKQVRAYIILTALSLALSAATIALCAGLMHEGQAAGDAPPLRAEAAQSVAEAVPVQSAAYLLRSVGGEVCVLAQDGETIPTGLRVELLPQSDREALERGIPVHSRSALTALLEDLGS